MIKVTNRSLAEALFTSVESRPSEVTQICDNFIEFLRINRRLKSLPLILKTLEKVAEDRLGIKKVTVVSRFPLTGRARTAIERLVTKRTNSKGAMIDQKIDERLVGGVRISYDDTVIDLSLQTQFNNLLD
ncbi:F0F1 ATP synthase subunit delta [Candidatus Berkelbacteria bacterium]|nr:F0F1 ATP synthase subunit delta [Candidatus Berkelbacteria bacterium]